MKIRVSFPQPIGEHEVDAIWQEDMNAPCWTIGNAGWRPVDQPGWEFDETNDGWLAHRVPLV